MKRLLAGTVLLFAMGIGATAFAQSAGDDGLPLNGSSGDWQCNKVRFPKTASNARAVLTGASTSCSASGCSNGGGDADLYVYNDAGSAPGARVAGYVCRPYLDGDEESCSLGTSTTADTYYWACVDQYAAYSTVQLRAEYTMTSGTGAAADGSVNYYLDYWKNNLFLGIAYHRFGCFSSDIKIVDDTDYDGFADHDYCRQNYGFSDPGIRGGDGNTYMVSVAFYASNGWNYTSAKSRLDGCASSTNSAYGTPNFARRSSTCSYNLLTNCNSDCWIKKFSTCVAGSPISTLSPCW